MLSPASAFPYRRPACPYCGHLIDHWPRHTNLQSCQLCLRPMVLLRWPTDWNGPKRLRGLLDVGFAVYGLLTIGLVATFVITGLSPHAFAKGFSVLLFIIGSVLAADGVLGLRTGMDKTGRRFRSGPAVRVFAGGKLAAGVAAILLLCVGLTL